MKAFTPTIPRFMDRLLYLLLEDYEYPYLVGDYTEIYQEILHSKGKLFGTLWLCKQFIKLTPLYFMDLFIWSLAMIHNYLRIAFRNLFKHKGYSFINIIGLALGIATSLLILLWVMDELSYDRFHENASTLYRVEQEQHYSGEPYHVNVTPYPMGPGLKDEIPEVKDATRYEFLGATLLTYKDLSFYEEGTRAVDPSFLEMLSYKLIRGNPEEVLNQPFSMVITQEIAGKYFGSEDPIGKTVQVNNQFPFTITGVLTNSPSNSFLQFDILVPFHFIEDLGDYNESWGSNNIYTFLQLHEYASVPEVNQKITDIRHRHVAENITDQESLRRFNDAPKTRFMLNPLKDIHLHGFFGYGHPPGNIQYVTIFSIIASFVLLIACINFMNLATARSARRAKEVGLRKVVGACRNHLIRQFYSESILIACIAMIFGLILTVLFLPGFNILSGKDMSLSTILTWKFIIGLLAITLITGIISGSYPALFLSAFLPVKVLRGSTSEGTKSAFFRKALVVTQFSLSVLLIIGTIMVLKQLHFMRTKKLGYDKEHLIYTVLRGNTPARYETLKNQLLTTPGVENVTASWQYPLYNSANSGGADWDGKDPDQNVLIGINGVDFDYVETFKIEMADGRSFSKKFSTDTSSAFMVNQEVVKLMGRESVVGERFSFAGTDGYIIGVMNNYHFKTVRDNIEPHALVLSPGQYRFAVIRLDKGNITSAIENVRQIWDQVNPGYPFEYTFLDEDYDQMYRTEERIGRLLQTFAILAVFIASLGLFGLASYTAEQRTKEIGVRKVLGATVPNIVLLLSREFTKWVIVSNLIAWPVSFFLLRNWLHSFAYRTSLSWWIFGLSGLLALIIALLTVSFQAVKAALANPAKALKYE